MNRFVNLRYAQLIFTTILFCLFVFSGRSTTGEMQVLPRIAVKKIVITLQNDEKQRGYLVEVDDQHIYLAESRTDALIPFEADCERYTCIPIHAVKSVDLNPRNARKTAAGILGFLVFLGVALIGVFISSYSEEGVSTGEALGVIVGSALIAAMVGTLISGKGVEINNNSMERKAAMELLTTHTVKYIRKTTDYERRYGKEATLHLIRDGYYTPYQRYAFNLRRHPTMKAYVVHATEEALYVVTEEKNIERGVEDHVKNSLKIPISRIKSVRPK